MDTDTDADCTSGPCCDGGSFSADTVVCDTQTEYLCIGTCGGLLTSWTEETYCSGTSAACDGDVVTGSPTTIENCTEDHECNPVAHTCDLCSGGCDADGCIECAWTWEPIESDYLDLAPSATVYHAAVWAPELGEMLIWGGIPEASTDNYIHFYDPATDTWSVSGSSGAPFTHPTVVWTGSQALFWGGAGNIWGPTDTWAGMNLFGDAPTVDRWHAAVWTGDEMIVWGGSYDDDGTNYYLGDGYRYFCDPL